MGYASFGVYKINKSRRINYVLILLLIIVAYGILDEINNLWTIVKKCNYKNTDNKNELCGIKKNYNFLTKMLHDNSVLAQLIGVLLFKLLK